MDKKQALTEAVNGSGSLLDARRTHAMRLPHRYTKEELLDIKERPHSKRRPPCLSEKYDSDGVWDPEKWHASLYPNSGKTSPVEVALKKDLDSDRTSLVRRLIDPRERVKEDDLDVVLSPQRRSFGGGCHVTAAVSSRQALSPLEKENDCVRIIGGRRIGSGRIISARNFDKDRGGGGEKEQRDPRDARDRDREYKDKRFRREFGDGKRVFGERRRNDSYTEEEPEWFSAGPTSQSETIELTGFDDKILEEEHKGRKRARRRTASMKEGVECNGGVAEEEEMQSALSRETPAATADQEVPREAVLPETAPGGEFDFNEFFNLDKSVPGLASMIEDVLGEGAVSASRFSRWFSNPSRSGSRSSSLRSTPHEELERLAGLEQGVLSPGQNSGNYFAPIPLEDRAENKVDILEMLQKAKVDLKPLLSSLSANKEKLRESTHSGVVLSVEEVEAGLKGLKVDAEGKMAASEQTEASLNTVDSRHFKDGDMSAFNKLVSTMKASGTLPSQPKANQNLESHLMSPPEIAAQPAAKNILQEILGPPSVRPSPPSNVLSTLMGGLEPMASILGQRAPSPPQPPISQMFPTRAASADYLRHRVPSPVGFGPGSQPLLGDPFQGMHKSMSPAAAAQMGALELSQTAMEGYAFPHELAMVSNAYQPGFGKVQMEKNRDGFRNSRQPPLRVMKSPAVLGHRGNAASPPAAAAPSITSMLSPSFTPTSVIRKMYEGKDKSKDETGATSAAKTKLGNHEESLLPLRPADRANSPPASTKLATSSLQRPAGATPLSNANRCAKDHEFRTKSGAGSGGRRTPTMASPVPAAAFLRPVHQVPALVPHVPMVRPAHQLPPGLVQRMLAQGIHPQHLPPLLQAGMIAPGIDLAHLQGVSGPLLGQPCYPISAAGHPLLNPRPGTPLQLAMMQQQLHRSGSGNQASASAAIQTVSPNPALRTGPPPGHSPLANQRSGGGSPVGLAKWFGSDVLQQPLPSMPSKVISVDELEYRQ
ncbi:eukaryotic translation initiation factor 4E transporter isoform X1 [Sceloporus undulatus]|nr:eukaryotic translation initiation factor 4E transporter isoform X1 [Sceloporus undulatus]